MPNTIINLTIKTILYINVDNTYFNCGFFPNEVPQDWESQSHLIHQAPGFNRLLYILLI